jgi:hypothetical protein
MIWNKYSNSTLTSLNQYSVKAWEEIKLMKS